MPWYLCWCFQTFMTEYLNSFILHLRRNVIFCLLTYLIIMFYQIGIHFLVKFYKISLLGWQLNKGGTGLFANQQDIQRESSDHSFWDWSHTSLNFGGTPCKQDNFGETPVVNIYVWNPLLCRFHMYRNGCFFPCYPLFIWILILFYTYYTFHNGRCHFFF